MKTQRICSSVLFIVSCGCGCVDLWHEKNRFWIKEVSIPVHNGSSLFFLSSLRCGHTRRERLQYVCVTEFIWAFGNQVGPSERPPGVWGREHHPQLAHQAGSFGGPLVLTSRDPCGPCPPSRSSSPFSQALPLLFRFPRGSELKSPHP